MREGDFFCARGHEMHSEVRARIGPRSGVRAGFGTVSTTVMPSFNGIARRRSSVKVLSGHPAQPLAIGCRLVLNPGHASRSCLCFFLRTVLTVARP